MSHHLKRKVNKPYLLFSERIVKSIRKKHTQHATNTITPTVHTHTHTHTHTQTVTHNKQNH